MAGDVRWTQMDTDKRGIILGFIQKFEDNNSFEDLLYRMKIL
jgi:hypothetical protein